MTAIQDPATATYLDRTSIAYDVVAADYAELLRGLMAGATRNRAVLAAFAEIASGAAEEKEKQPQAYAVGVKPG